MSKSAFRIWWQYTLIEVYSYIIAFISRLSRLNCAVVDTNLMIGDILISFRVATSQFQIPSICTSHIIISGTICLILFAYMARYNRWYPSLEKSVTGFYFKPVTSVTFQIFSSLKYEGLFQDHANLKINRWS